MSEQDQDFNNQFGESPLDQQSAAHANKPQTADMEAAPATAQHRRRSRKQKPKPESDDEYGDEQTLPKKSSVDKLP